MSDDNNAKEMTSNESNSERREQRDSSQRNTRPPRRTRGRRRRRQNSYCPEGKCYDYKDYETLKQHLNETGKIKPRRQTGNCSRCQRELAREVKRARHLALLPYVDAGE